MSGQIVLPDLLIAIASGDEETLKDSGLWKKNAQAQAKQPVVKVAPVAAKVVSVAVRVMPDCEHERRPIRHMPRMGGK